VRQALFTSLLRVGWDSVGWQKVIARVNHPKDASLPNMPDAYVLGYLPYEDRVKNKGDPIEIQVFYDLVKGAERDFLARTKTQTLTVLDSVNAN